MAHAQAKSKSFLSEYEYGSCPCGRLLASSDWVLRLARVTSEGFKVELSALFLHESVSSWFVTHTHAYRPEKVRRTEIINKWNGSPGN